MDANAYARQLKQLLPSGSLLRVDTGSVLHALMLGIGDELARVDGRAETLLEELDPRTTLELLPDWEEAVSLPDDVVTTIPTTTTERRLAIVTKLLARGGQSRQFFIDLAAAAGFLVTISEYKVCRAGSMRSGDRCYNTPWAFAWLMNVSLSSPALAGWSGQSVFFRAGAGRSGDRLRSWSGPILQAIIGRAKPAHTIVLFSYA